VVQLNAIYERDTLTPALPGDHIDIDSAAVDGYHPDYALLSLNPWIGSDVDLGL
jgi:hypothetical protein